MKQDYLQMRVLELAPQVYVCGQVFETDLKLIARQGVRTIVSNRPDGEAPGQPSTADLARAAEELGITFVHFPIEAGPISRQTAVDFARTCEDLARPMLVFSRSGARSMKLWEMSEAL